MSRPQTLADLVEEFEAEAKANRVLRDRYGERGDELWTQYDSTARAFEQAARSAKSLIEDPTVTPNYASIECVRDITEEWIQLWSGDEWGEVMGALHAACHVDYGVS